MRALVDLDERKVRRLDLLAQVQKRSRAALIRDAVDDYLRTHDHKNVDDAFGLWRDQAIDGLAYQEKVRSEW